MQEYTVEGCCVWYEFFNSFNEKDKNTMMKRINSPKNDDGFYEIKIYPYPNYYCDDKDEAKTVNNYFKTYKSSKKFTVGRVLSLIHETMMCAMDDIFEGNDLCLADQSLVGFECDSRTGVVHPSTNS